MQTAQSVILFALYPAAAVMAGGAIALWRTTEIDQRSAAYCCWSHFAVND